MDFSLSEAQTELAGLARKILAERDTPERQWADLAAAGVLAAGLPEPLGGAGLGFLEQCSVLAEVGRAVSPVPYLASVVLGAGAIAAFGRRGPAAAVGRSRPGTARWCSPPRWPRRTAMTRRRRRRGPSAPAARWRLSGVKTAVPRAARGLASCSVPASAAGRGAGVPRRAVGRRGDRRSRRR